MKKLILLLIISITAFAYSCNKEENTDPPTAPEAGELKFIITADTLISGETLCKINDQLIFNDTIANGTSTFSSIVTTGDRYWFYLRALSHVSSKTSVSIIFNNDTINTIEPGGTNFSIIVEGVAR